MNTRSDPRLVPLSGAGAVSQPAVNDNFLNLIGNLSRSARGTVTGARHPCELARSRHRFGPAPAQSGPSPLQVSRDGDARSCSIHGPSREAPAPGRPTCVHRLSSKPRGGWLVGLLLLAAGVPQTPEEPFHPGSGGSREEPAPHNSTPPGACTKSGVPESRPRLHVGRQECVSRKDLICGVRHMRTPRHQIHWHFHRGRITSCVSAAGPADRACPAPEGRRGVGRGVRPRPQQTLVRRPYY